MVLVFVILYKVILTFESVREILKCDHSLERYWAVLSYSTASNFVQGDSTFRTVDEIHKCDTQMKAIE